METIDLTGSISVVSSTRLPTLLNTPISDSDSSEDKDNHRHRRNYSASLYAFEEPASFARLHYRLRSAYSIPPRILGPFVITSPSLTHFGLSSMLACPGTLDGLAASPSVCLQSPSLARHGCVSLTGWKVRSALAACCITELSLHGYIIIPLRNHVGWDYPSFHNCYPFCMST